MTIETAKTSVNTGAVILLDAIEYLRSQEQTLATEDLDGSLAIFHAIDILDNRYVFLTDMFCHLHKLQTCLRDHAVHTDRWNELAARAE